MNPHFIKKALQKERAFIRKFGKEGYLFYTVKGARPNQIQKVTPEYIYFTTEKSKRPNRIPRSSLRRALAWLLYRRVTTLRLLVKLNSYSSAIAGLLKTVLSDISKVTKTRTGAVRISLRGLRYIFSGVSKAKRDIKIIRENGGNFILLNYVNIRHDLQENWKRNLLQLGYDYKCVLLDPGAKTIADAEIKGKVISPIDLDAYADFVKRHSDIIFDFMTVDVIGDPVTTRMNAMYLERVVGRKPIPVFHVQNSLDVLEQMIDEEHEVIAIGGSALGMHPTKRAAIFTEIFDRFGDQANFHALGLGDPKLLLQFPWYSADASSWLNGRIYRTLITMAGNVVAPIKMSSVDALSFNVRTLVALEERYEDLQLNFDLISPVFGEQW